MREGGKAESCGEFTLESTLELEQFALIYPWTSTVTCSRFYRFRDCYI